MLLKHAMAAVFSAGTLLLPVCAEAAACNGPVTLPVTCTGTLDAESGTPGSVIVEAFTLTAPSAVTMYTTSYGGGMNLDGTTSPAGGFQPNLTLFDSTGFAVAYENGTTSPIANTDHATGLALDGYVMDSAVASGSYYAVLTDANNMVSASFTGFGNTAPSQFYTFFSGPGGNTFSDAQGNARNSSYALNIESTPLTSATPEPASALLVLPAVALGFFISRKQRSASLPAAQ